MISSAEIQLNVNLLHLKTIVEKNVIKMHRHFQKLLPLFLYMELNIQAPHNASISPATATILDVIDVINHIYYMFPHKTLSYVKQAKKKYTYDKCN